ncbi:DUF6747 family protein [Flagellimonas sp. S174]|uniref:Uncharacterized protein n=1 Tax=Flagellimonas meridianipacifica TaxID=1080225 RepID=A0A2T0MCK7_9FLAO|nr:DUF6747 family protein [Allomuricauda pacifica]PRX55222.1 hypothetical protein CLV81_3631 [Allomuricauda pacifica]
MNQILLAKRIYKEAFMNLGHRVLRNGFKLYFWTCTALLAMVLYAFCYRLFTGFAWD